MACGLAGAEYLKDKYVNEVMPSASRPCSLEDSKAAAKQLQDSGAFKWAHAATRTELLSATKIIESLLAGHPLEPSSAGTPWLQRIQQQCSYYVSWTQPSVEAGKAGEEDGDEDLYGHDSKTLYGAAALKQLFQEVRDTKPQEKLKLKDYALFGTLRHLLSNEMRSDLDARVQRLYAAEVPKSSAKSKPVAKPARPSKTKIGGEDEARALACNLLGL